MKGITYAPPPGVLNFLFWYPTVVRPMPSRRLDPASWRGCCDCCAINIFGTGTGGCPGLLDSDEGKAEVMADLEIDAANGAGRDAMEEALDTEPVLLTAAPATVLDTPSLTVLVSLRCMNVSSDACFGPPGSSFAVFALDFGAWFSDFNLSEPCKITAEEVVGGSLLSSLEGDSGRVGAFLYAARDGGLKGTDFAETNTGAVSNGGRYSVR